MKARIRIKPCSLIVIGRRRNQLKFNIRLRLKKKISMCTYRHSRQSIVCTAAIHDFEIGSTQPLT